MKRNCSISVIALSILLFLLFATIPHHHHGRIACVIIELCEEDNTINDEHTHHSETDSKKNHDESCIAESEFTIPSSIDEIKSKLSPNHNNTTLFPVLFLAGDLINHVLAESGIKSDYEEHILTYKSIDASQSHGLRAPPFSFS